MQRINTSYFYKLAQKLIPLRKIADGQDLYFENYQILFGAQEELRFFLTNELLPPLTSYRNGNTLFEAIEKIAKEDFVAERKLQWFEAQGIIEALNHFEIALQSDFATRDTFIVSPKATHSTTLLSENGENAVSISARKLVPSIAKDLHDAGRCIAFELPTAGAFHLFRAVEAMVKAYGEFLLKRSFTEAEIKNGLGGYANSIKQRNLLVDKRIPSAIEQIASLHRNPTMHPEMHISNTEIIATLGIVVSVIETIAIDWNRREVTPEVPLSEVLPDDSKVIALLEDGNENKPSEPESIRPNNEENSLSFKIRTAKKNRGRKSKFNDGDKEGAT
jgi:hypothetical protein